MRNIDADALLKRIAEETNKITRRWNENHDDKEPGDWDIGHFEMVEMISEAIKNAPTVETGLRDPLRPAWAETLKEHRFFVICYGGTLYFVRHSSDGPEYSRLLRKAEKFLSASSAAIVARDTLPDPGSCIIVPVKKTRLGWKEAWKG